MSNEETETAPVLPTESGTLLKKPEILRDAEGRFEQRGKGIKKHAKTSKAITNLKGQGGLTGRGPGRPKGSKNKVGTALKDLILMSLDELGAVQYLKTLAIENSSAYAGLLGKVLPAQERAEPVDRTQNKIVFERVIVMPNGHRHIEGKTPLPLPAPDGLAHASLRGPRQAEPVLERSALNTPSNPTAASLSREQIVEVAGHGQRLAASSHTLPRDEHAGDDTYDIKDLD